MNDLEDFVLAQHGDAQRAARQVRGAAQVITGELDMQAVLAYEGRVQWVEVAGISRGRSARVVIGQMTEQLRRRRIGEGRDVDQEERRQCARVDSRAGAA
jgi:hypothetical protein